MGWMIGVLGFDSQRGLGIFLFTTTSRIAVGPTQPHIQWVPGALALGVKRPGNEADHSPPSSAEVKNEWSCTSTPQYVFMAWCLVKNRDFTFFIITNRYIYLYYTFIFLSLPFIYTSQITVSLISVFKLMGSSFLNSLLMDGFQDGTHPFHKIRIQCYLL
jgi:hypothetical protein